MIMVWELVSVSKDTFSKIKFVFWENPAKWEALVKLMEVANVMKVSKTMEDTVLNVLKELSGVNKQTLVSMSVVKILLLTKLPTNASVTPDMDF